MSCVLVRSRAGFLLPLALALLSARTAAQLQKINGELPRDAIGLATSFHYSPDSTRVVFLSDEGADEVFELYSVPSDGSQAPVRLNGTLVSGGDVSGAAETFQISPDSSFVAYLADQETDDVSELYVVPIDGSGAAAKRSGTLVPGGDVTRFRISADGSLLVYLADQDTDGVQELYGVPSDGSQAPWKLSGALVSGGNVLDFALDANGSRIAYLADQDTDQRNEVYGAPSDGSQPAQRLNEPLDANENVDAFRIAPDGTRVVYRADQDANDVFELFSAPSDGSLAAVRLNGALVTGGDVTEFAIASDGSRAVYRADQDTNDKQELYSVPLDGSQAALKLHPSGKSVSAFQIRPGASHVLFLADLDTAGKPELYSVPLAGGVAPTKLNPPLPASHLVTAFEIGSDDLRVLYTRDRIVLDNYGGAIGIVQDLFSVPVGGGTALQLSDPSASFGLQFLGLFSRLSPGGQHVLFQSSEWTPLFSVPMDGSLPPVAVGADWEAEIAPDGNHMVFRTFGDAASPARLVGATPRGENRVPLNMPPLLGATNGDVLDFRATPDGLQIVYRDGARDPARLHVVSPGGRAPARLLSDPTSLYGEVPNGLYWLSPDSQRAAYLSRDEITRRYGLHAVSLRTNAPRVDLDPTHSIQPELSVAPRFTPDSRSIVYSTVVAAARRELFVVPAQGDAGPLQLSGPFTGLSGLWLRDSVPGVRISADGQWVVYCANPNGRYEIFSVPIDRSVEPVRLNQDLVTGSHIHGRFLITPDGGRVLYLGEVAALHRPELFSVPIGGSSPPIKLNGALVPGGYVGFYGEDVDIRAYVQVTPDGSRAVYLADQDVDGRDELYSVPTDGSAAAVKLNGALTSGGDVAEYAAISPDGTRVVYRADAIADGRFELYSVPVDGSAAAVRISGTMVAGGSVRGGSRPVVLFAGNRVLYLADQDTDEVVELYSAPIDGSAPAVRVSGPMVSGGDVVLDGFEAIPSGDKVFYRADQEQDEVFELFVAPVDGSAAPTKLSGTLVSGGDVQAGVAVAPSGLAVVFRADHDADDTFELFSYRFPHAHRTAKAR